MYMYTNRALCFDQSFTTILKLLNFSPPRLRVREDFLPRLTDVFLFFEGFIVTLTRLFPAVPVLFFLLLLTLMSSDLRFPVVTPTTTPFFLSTKGFLLGDCLMLDCFFSKNLSSLLPFLLLSVTLNITSSSSSASSSLDKSKKFPRFTSSVFFFFFVFEEERDFDFVDEEEGSLTNTTSGPECEFEVLVLRFFCVLDGLVSEIIKISLSFLPLYISPL
mmetsp:Transcript_11551/g.21173  ORF Transcript_11551/g.21173 Transcript_11551/m.21173 type:complete len:218 (+) Transcript_11551:201-854(+)